MVIPATCKTFSRNIGIKYGNCVKNIIIERIYVLSKSALFNILLLIERSQRCTYVSVVCE